MARSKPGRRGPGNPRTPSRKPSRAPSRVPSRKSPSSKSPKKGSGKKFENGERVLVDLGDGKLAKATKRVATKAKLTETAPTKGPSGKRYLRGAKGAKSIKLIFKLADKSSSGNRMALPVPGNATIDDYIRIATTAGAEGFVTPDGVSYPIGSASGGGGNRPRGTAPKAGKAPRARRTPTRRRP